MSQQNIYQYNFKKWYVKPSSQFFDISLASDEIDFNEEVVFSTKLIGQDNGNVLPIYFDLNNSGSSQMVSLSYGDFVSGNTLISLNYYNPNNENISCFTSSTLCDVGLTGIDNGLVPNFSGETIQFTMGLYTGGTKWDRYSFDRRTKLIPITSYTNTPVNLSLSAEYEPGSVIANYFLLSDLVLDETVTVSFTNILGLSDGTSILITTGVTINSGNFSGNSEVILNENFNNLTRVSTFSGITSNSNGSEYNFDITQNAIFPTPTPTTTQTPTVTPTLTQTPTITDTQTPTPTITETPTNTLTNTLTNTETPTNTPTPSTTINPTITPTNTETPTNTPTNTTTPTSSITPSITQTSTTTNSVTPTITPSSSSSGGGIVSGGLFMKLEGSDYSGSGQWLDGTVNGNNGTINGATYLSDYGGIFDFDGVNDTISVAHTSNLSLSTTQQRTVQVWVRFDEIPSLNAQIPVFGKLSSLSGFDGYWGGLFSNGGVVRVTTNGTSTQKVSDSILTINSNTWYLFTFISQITSALNTTKVYINETEYISTQHGSDTYSESNPFYLGFIGSGVGSLYLNGKIGSCYFYTKGLNTSEISQNYNNTKDRYVEVTPTPTSTPTNTPTPTTTPTNTPTP